MTNEQRTTVGSLIILGVFGALIYTASYKKALNEVEVNVVLPEILPVVEAKLPPLTNKSNFVEDDPFSIENQWEALIPDGIPLLPIEGISVMSASDLPALVGDK